MVIIFFPGFFDDYWTLFAVILIIQQVYFWQAEFFSSKILNVESCF